MKHVINKRVRKNKIHISIITSALVFACVTSVVSYTQVNASVTSNEIVLKNKDTDNEEIEFIYSSSALDNSAVHLKNSAVYKTEHFTKDSREYNHELAKLSLSMALATSTTAESKDNWGTDFNDIVDTSEDIDNIDPTTARNAYIVEVYKKLGFYNDIYSKYEVSLNDTSDTVAYSIAMKKIKVDGKKHTLLICNARSVSYGAEWASNFSTYNEEGITGFEAAGKQFYQAIKAYIKEHNLGKNTKVWIPGYSRGGAAANVAAGMLNKDIASGVYKFGHDDVYSYIYATPLSVLDEEYDSEIHNNIFNILNEADIVPRLAPRAWGFRRYGRCYYVPQLCVSEKDLEKIADGKNVKLDEESIEVIKNVSYDYNVIRHLNNITNHEMVDLKKLYIGFTVTKDLNIIVDNVVLAVVDSPKDYSEKYQGVAKDIVPFMSSHSRIYSDSEGKWVPYDNLADYMKDKYGDGIFEEAEKVGVYSKEEHMDKLNSIKNMLFVNDETKKAFEYIVDTYYGIRIIAYKYGIDVEDIKDLTNKLLDFMWDYMDKFNISDPLRCKYVHYAEFYMAWMENYNPYTESIIKK